MSPSPRTAQGVAGAPAPRSRPSSAEHVVFGAGAVGLAIADALLARGVAPGQVRVVSEVGEGALFEVLLPRLRVRGRRTARRARRVEDGLSIGI